MLYLVADIRPVLAEIAAFEKKKLVLPILTVMLLLSGVFVLEDMRNQEIFEKTSEKNVDRMANLSIMYAETNFFNGSIDYNREDRVESWEPEENAWANLRENQKFKYYLGFYSAGAVYKTPLYPIAPGGTSLGILTGSSRSKHTVFGLKQGYVLLEAPINSMVRIAYMQERYGQLSDRVNRSPENWTLEDYRERAYEISDAEVTDPEVREFVLETEGENAVLDPMRNQRYDLAERAVKGELKEVGPVHFIPAAVVAFIWIYILSGTGLTGIRTVREKLAEMK